MEGAQGAAIVSGAFGKQQQWTTVLEIALQLLIEPLAIAGTATDEQRAGLVRQPAGQWPAAYFGLGQEGQRGELAEQRDVCFGKVFPRCW